MRAFLLPSPGRFVFVCSDGTCFSLCPQNNKSGSECDKQQVEGDRGGVSAGVLAALGGSLQCHHTRDTMHWVY